MQHGYSILQQQPFMYVGHNAFYWCYHNLGMPGSISVLVALFLTSLLSIVCEVGVYQPLHRKQSSLNIVMISSIGLMIVLTNLVALFFGNDTKVIDNSIQPVYEWGRLLITRPQLLQLTIGSSALALLLIVLKYTHLGLKIKALSSDRVLAEVMV